MPQPSHNHILPSLSTLGALAREAGQITLRFFRHELTERDKGGNLGIVTEADLASEKHIKSFIAANFAGHSVLAEESGWEGVEEETATPIWIIDPLDGTTNFSKGNPYYCVSIAVGMRTGEQCDLRLAAIHHPPTDDLYLAQFGKGAWLNGTRIEVSKLELLERSSLATGFSGAKGDQLRWVTDAIFATQNAILGTRINGAAALDLAMTARGVFQGFYEQGLSSWDMAAGALILAEAGARVTDIEGRTFRPLVSRSICAANPAMHERIQALLATLPPWPEKTKK